MGILILLLLAGVVAGFVTQSLTNKDYLFALSEGAFDESGDKAAGFDGGTGQPGGDEAESDGAADLFPSPADGDWQAPKKVSRYTPDNLYMKIDGRADIYLQYQVAGLLFGTYSRAGDEQRTIDVFWYDMGKPENATGIYRAEAPPDATKAAVGRQGYQADGAVFYVKGASYVQVLPAGPDDSDGLAAMQIAEAVADQITESDQADWASDVLPKRGRVEGSLEFLGADAFELDFLSNVYTAEYEVEGGRIKLFIHRADDEAAAKGLFDKYRAFFAEFGEVVWTDPDQSRRMVAGMVSGAVDVVFAKGRYLGGVAQAEDLEAAKKAAADFFRMLPESQSQDEVHTANDER